MSTHHSISAAGRFREASRINTSPMAAIERRCLVWIAARLPSWVSSDQLTLLALVSMAGAGGCFWAAGANRAFRFGAIGCLMLNWFGDSLDGTLARVRNQQRPRYGFYTDHIVDCFGVVFLCGGLALSGFMHPLVAMGVLVAYFLLSIDVYLATYSLSVFRLSFWAMGPTELRLLLAVGALALRHDPHVSLLGASLRLFDAGGSVAIVCLSVTALTSVVRNVRALYRAEPLPGGRSPRAGESTRAAGSTSVPVARRWIIFNAVGFMGFAVQLAMVWALTAAGLSYIVSTALGVEAAILHNFFWHVSCTWAGPCETRRAALTRFLRFNLTTGLVSIGGNVVITGLLVDVVGLHYLVANAIAVGVCSGVNFLLSHRVTFAAALAVLLTMTAADIADAADLSPAASAAFDREAGRVEARLDEERAGRAPLFWVDRLAADQQRDAYTRMSNGEIVVHRLTNSPVGPAPGGTLLHHWIATVRVADTSLDKAIHLMQGYAAYEEVYRPAVRRAREVSRHDGVFTVSLQLYFRHVISVVLNTESRVSYLPAGQARMQVRSVGTHVAEVLEAGGPGEHEAPVGHDSGYLWRFNNYCALEERRDAVYIQCETLSLTRNTPFGLGWLIGPLVNSIPRESLEFTLEAMRTALVPGSKG